MCVQCLYVQYTNHAPTVAGTNLHGLITCVMSPYPRTKGACRLPSLRHQHTAEDVALVEEQHPRTTSTAAGRPAQQGRRPQSPRTEPQAPPPAAAATSPRIVPPNRRVPVQIPPARRRLPPSEPSVVDPHRRPSRVHISSRRGRSKVRTQFRPRVRTQPRTFSGTENSAKIPLNSFIGIDKQTAR